MPDLNLDAIEGMYREHHGWLHEWLRRRLGNRDRAADLAHDTFVRILDRRERLYVLEARRLLATVAKGLLIDHYRRAALEQAWLDALAVLPPTHAPSPEARVAALQLLAELDRALATIPLRARRTFLMAQLEGLGYAAIAERHGVSVRSVQNDMTLAWRACYAIA
ncbi:sigma-70 family RNA polymerase sigma factor [Verticiella sediminum]|uniref:Sigma-70 family RNA polymerase sigma factor n=1 Tax=Verticiella sediminum TaxID=1247510 RepID=A0A556AEC2_9BURK|nr:sigma-70 family RNA polymerase sigma factor [Verticiella sediminum]TSH91244.1 sigma-70 family RNA polymerase sigma factor [Verticiella sediminum]